MIIYEPRNLGLPLVANPALYSLKKTFRSDMPVPTKMCNSDEEMDEIDTSESAVYQKLRNLDPEKAVGDDNINPAILRNVADQFAVPLSIIFTTSMRTGKIPKDWRTANVTPIYKKGSKNVASNYRPISLTSQVCKVMEKLVKESISTNETSSGNHNMASWKGSLV